MKRDGGYELPKTNAWFIKYAIAMRKGARMAVAKLVLIAAIASLPAVAAQSAQVPSPAPNVGSEDSAVIAERTRNTERALLEDLVERRAAVAKAPAGDVHRAELEFLDQRIAQLSNRLGK